MVTCTFAIYPNEHATLMLNRDESSRKHVVPLHPG